VTRKDIKDATVLLKAFKNAPQNQQKEIWEELVKNHLIQPDETKVSVLRVSFRAILKRCFLID
jgi:hypothetical protein